MRANIVRANIDNDVNLNWANQGVYNAYSVVESYKIENGSVKLNCLMVSPFKRPLLQYTIIYSFAKEKVEISVDYKFGKYLSELPRFGFTCGIDKNDSKEYQYFGMGEQESYIDKNNASSLGFYSMKTSDNTCPYLIPQEYGTHSQTSSVSIVGSNSTINILTNDSMYFSLKPYCDSEIKSRRHNYELQEDSNNYLYLDLDMRGIGSESCGPRLQDEYRITKGRFLTFIIEIIK